MCSQSKARADLAGACPTHDTDQVSLIEEMMNAFRGYADQRRLAELLYYAWIDTRENFGVYRCGVLTETGKLALSAM
jgi:hypothetical protein